MKVALIIVGAIFILFALHNFSQGDFFTWKPPFSKYELATIGSGVLGVIFIFIGISSENSNKN